MDWTRVGIWLVGAGSFVSVLVAVLGSPHAGEAGLRFLGPLGSNRGRVIFAAEASAVAHIALGSVILAVVQTPEWWIALGTAGTLALGVYALTVWKQHEYRAARAVEVATQQSSDPAAGRWRNACTRRCASWRWCLQHPFDDDMWPRDCWSILGGPEREELSPSYCLRTRMRLERVRRGHPNAD